MKRNILKCGAAVMAGVFAMSVLLAVPVLPARATETENNSIAPVSGNDAETNVMRSAEIRAAASTGTIGAPDGNGDVLEWSYDDSTQTLTITGTGSLSGGGLKAEPFESMEIRKVQFQDCKVIGSMANAFGAYGSDYNISNVEQIDFSGLDTSSVTDMHGMFYGCSSLRSLDLSSFTPVNVTDMSQMFYDCRSLESLDLSSFTTGNVTNMSYMFSGCNSLGSLDLSSFTTGNVTDMGYMFYGCSGLGSLDLSSFTTVNVTDMGSMFSGCNSLESLDLSSFTTVNVTDMGYMFSVCRSLESLDLSSFTTRNVTDMGYMFYGCRSLGSLDLSSFTTGNVTDMGFMFLDCSSLGSLDLSSFTTGNVTDMGGMFYGCSSLGSLDLSSFTTGNVTDMRSMFSGCSSLESLDLSSFTTGNVTDMGDMFSGCSSLGTLDLSSFDFGNISHDCEGMLYGCGALSTLYTPYNMKISVVLPAKNNTVWYLPDGTEVTELPQNLSTSVLLTRSPDITTSTEELNMSDVVRVKYVPYSYTIRTDNTDPGNQVTFSVVEGRLAEGLQMYPATGEIYGVPLEAGEFKMTVQASYSDPKYPPAYAELTLIVLDNTDENVGNASDSGYEITQPVPNLNIGGLSGSDTQLLVSEGEYTEFQDAVYLDGRRLQSGIEYTSDAGSTRITIRNQTLADAGTGSHTLSLEFRTQGTGELRRAAQNLVISGMENSEGTGNSGNMDNDADYDGRDEVSVSDPVTVIDYVVQPGDSLWEIAGRFFGNGNYWRRIYQDNVDGIRNPNRLRVGQHLIIYMTVRNGMTGMSAMTWNTSMSVSGNNYIVQPGDNLWRIAGKVYGKNERWREIYEANRNLLSNPERIYAKQVLVIP